MRIYYWVDAGILLGFFTLEGTGLAISSWLDLAFTNYSAWLTVHIVSSILTLLATVVKIGFHWRWIVNAARKRLAEPAAEQTAVSDLSKRNAPNGGWLSEVRPLAPGSVVKISDEPSNPAKPVAAQPGAGGRRLSRREFLELMGGVSAVTALALNSAVEGLQSADGESTSARQGASAAVSNEQAAYLTGSTSQSSSACAVQCNRRCPYPGHCRRCQDTDGNNRCDFGECA